MKKTQSPNDLDALEEENWHLRQELFYLKSQNNVSQQKQKNGQPAPAKPWKKAEAIVLAIGIIIVGLMMLLSNLVQNIPQSQAPAIPTLLVLPTGISSPTNNVDTNASIKPTVYEEPTVMSTPNS